jgi:hypothetical protein
MYTFNDIEGFPENTSVRSFKWWRQNEGTGVWVNLGVNSSTLQPSYFDLDDKLICSVKVKDSWRDWNNIDRSLWSVPIYTNSSSVTVSIEPQKPTGEGDIIIGIG